MNEKQHIQKAQKGDAASFAFLIEKYKDMAFSIALRVVENSEDARDTAQDAFVKAYQGLGSFGFDSKFSTWLYRIVYNTAISAVRKRKTRREAANQSPMPESVASQNNLALAKLTAKERQKALKKALDKLNQTNRLLITLYYLEEQSVDEIAQITQLSRENVKVRLFRARKELHLWLKKDLKTEMHSIV